MAITQDGRHLISINRDVISRFGVFRFENIKGSLHIIPFILSWESNDKAPPQVTTETIQLYWPYKQETA